MDSAGEEEVVTVSQVIGREAEARRIVRVGAWSFTAPGAEGTELLVRDTDAAERLGFSRPRDIRKLIERIWPEDQRPACRATVGRQRTGFGEREYTVNEYWFSEAQLLKVIARSETPIADAILDEMIRVFMLARRGLLPQQRPPTLDVESLRAVVAALVAEQVGRMHPAAPGASAPTSEEVLGSLDRETVLQPVVKIARTLAGPGAGARHVAVARGRVDGRIRTRLGWRTHWRSFPRSRLGELLAVLQAETLYAEDVAEGVASVRRNSIRAVR